MFRAATGATPAPKPAKPSPRPVIPSNAPTAAPSAVTAASPLVIPLTQRVSLKLIPPAAPPPVQKPAQPNPGAGGSWASLLTGKAPSKSINSPPKANPPSPISISPPPRVPVTHNPYAPKPGEPVHPFFMTAEARKELKIKENQVKLEADVAKRAAELRAKATVTSNAMNAFFAPRARPVASSPSESTNPEIRAKYAQYGTNIPNFPSIAHVTPPPSIAPNPSPLHRLQLEFDHEADTSALLTLPEPSEILTLFQRRIDTSPSESKSQNTLRSEQAAAEEHEPIGLGKTVVEILQSYGEIRRSLGMISGVGVLKRQESATAGVPLLDVRAEDMAAFLALQQQEAAQRLVAEEQRSLANKSSHPAYGQEEMEELYRSMLKQSSSNFALPWSSRFSPQRSQFVCGNSVSARTLKEWLIRWKAASEGQTDAATNARTNSSGSGALSSFFQKKPSSSNLSTSQPKSTLSGSATPSQNSQSQPKSNENSQASSATESVSNAFVLSGPIGSGKTSAIYAVAAEMDFSVLEINASMKRSGASLRTMVEEATQSRHVGRDASTLTILLFEEVDLSFAEDAGFFQALVSLCESTKRPIVLTCQSVPVFLQSKLQSVSYQEMRRPDEASIFAHLSFACLASGLTAPPPYIVHQLVLWFDYDLRRIFNNMQFWAPYLSAFGWDFSVRALAGLIVSSDSNDDKHCLKQTRNDLNSIFLYSESEELPDSLDLLHRHFLLHSPPDAPHMTMKSASRAADSIAISDTWHPAPLHDEWDTAHDTQRELFSSLQRFTLSVDMQSGPCSSCSSCYSLGTTNRHRNVLQLVDGVSSAMTLKSYASSSSLNQFENMAFLGLLAQIEDENRLQNTKRRKFTPKVDWGRVSPLQRLNFVKAVKLPAVPSEPKSPRSTDQPENEESVNVPIAPQ